MSPFQVPSASLNKIEVDRELRAGKLDRAFPMTGEVRGRGGLDELVSQ